MGQGLTYNKRKPGYKTVYRKTRRKKKIDSTPVDHRSQRNQTLDPAKPKLTASWPHREIEITDAGFRFPAAISLLRSTNPPQASHKVSLSDEAVRRPPLQSSSSAIPEPRPHQRGNTTPLLTENHHDSHLDHFRRISADDKNREPEKLDRKLGIRLQERENGTIIDAMIVFFNR
ncbi:predicted protein [Arabidopsis lyrata subsp. lyrata]|uniref:Predicted protein n=1 Tax=Arabidopsis lyrata subsp. lyrata TaxID=81972 RepID=D7L0A9_ARALL|nr:predicted protein [Arabidopsis lyrata subsp. lyrata]